MHTLIGAFTLSVQPADGPFPPRVSITLVGAATDAQGVIHVTPNCATLDELEAASTRSSTS